MRKITMIPGDGIGPEVTDAVKQVVAATDVEIQWDEENGGEEAFKKSGHYLPPTLLESINQNRIAFKGPITTPIGKGFRSINVTLRQEYDTYANVRPVKSIPGMNTPFQNVDLVIVRENSEDLYKGIEHMLTDGVAEAIKLITAKASHRIALYAFQYAEQQGRKKVTAVHKANIMKITDGLFLETVRTVAAQYPHIEYEEVIIDNMCMQLVMRPEKYDVILASNLYGDILSDLAAGLVGGLGLVPGANIGKDVAIFEAVHGSAPDIAGQNLANPTACILSAAMMMDYLGELQAAQKIREAVFQVLAQGTCLTKDLGGVASTTEFTDAVCRAIQDR